ncbi:hypothetical protein KDD93_07525 [Campylobacter sp. faydin G-24]|uniref:Uncharacterized protein n=1 Tax=Campylobacter anatolicus TaxID=2829105 RepID=A0ABS5HL01_9BACT|nr:hypothetical protein [Campylobacter anatolicus]MBR8464412.1 hypothetical protein [Campylobacter anatolicus]
MRELLKALNQAPISYYPIYAKLTGSVTSAILLSQLIDCFERSGKNKIYKSNDELMAETTLSVDEFKSAKNKIKNLDFIKVTLEGLPAKTYYEINWDRHEQSLINLTKTSKDKK